jgi:hypothetical protein
MMARRLLALAVALSCSLLAGSACAEDLTYRFDDDLLDAQGLDSKAALIKVRQPKVRVTLIRPRASFVPELLKSVEQI